MARLLAGHPPGLLLVSLTQAWERFSYFGMVSLLPLFLTTKTTLGGFGWSDGAALRFLGLYMALTYISPLIGGWIADRYAGLQRALVLGAIFMMSGHFLMTVPGALPHAIEWLTGVPAQALLQASGAQLGGITLGARDAALLASVAGDAAPTLASAYLAISWSFYAAILLLIIGAGLFIPAATVLVGELYAADSPHRNAGYSLFYSILNLGSFLGILIVGFIGEKIGWHFGFSCAAIGLLIGLVVLLIRRKRDFGDAGLAPRGAGAGGAGAQFRLNPPERRGVAAIFLLTLFNTIFWIGYAQSSGLLNLYVYHDTDRMLFGFEVPATWLLSLTSLFVVLLGPVFALIWTRLDARNAGPGTAGRFAIGLFLMSAALMLVLGAFWQSDTAADGKSAMLWLVFAYLLLVMGEMCVGPVGFAAAARWAPARLSGMMLGVWFLSDAISHFVGGWIGAMAETVDKSAIIAGLAAMGVVSGLIIAIAARGIESLAGEPPRRRLARRPQPEMP